MEKSGFFNGISGDRKYKASDFAEYFNSFITNGVFPNPSSNLQVIANNNMTISLKSGKAWINGYIYINTDDLILSIDPADGTLNRIDRIVLKYDTVNRIITAQVKKGTFASSPTAPALQRDADAYELGIADINVAKGIVSIPQSNITDTRLNTSLCGIVNSLIQADTTTLLNQYESGMQNKEAQFTQDFNTWFATIRAALDGDTAGNLLNLINNHKDDNTLHKTANIPMTSYVMSANGGAISPTDTINQAIGKLEKNAESHLADIAKHITADERAAWNNKLDKSGGVLTGDFSINTGAGSTARFYFDDALMFAKNSVDARLTIASDGTVKAVASNTILATAKGIWSDTSTSIPAGATYTKTIPIGFNAKKGRIILKGVDDSKFALIHITTDANDATSIWAALTNTVRGFSKPYNGHLTDSVNGSVFSSNGNIEILDAYILGTNLLIVFKNTSTSAATLNIHQCLWEVEG